MVSPGAARCHRVRFGVTRFSLGIAGHRLLSQGTGWCHHLWFGVTGAVWCHCVVQCHPQPSALGTRQGRPLPIPTPPRCVPPPGITHPTHFMARCWCCPQPTTPQFVPSQHTQSGAPRCSPRFSNVPSPVPSSPPCRAENSSALGMGAPTEQGGPAAIPWHSSQPMVTIGRRGDAVLLAPGTCCMVWSNIGLSLGSGWGN